MKSPHFYEATMTWPLDYNRNTQTRLNQMPEADHSRTQERSVYDPYSQNTATQGAVHGGQKESTYPANYGSPFAEQYEVASIPYYAPTAQPLISPAAADWACKQCGFDNFRRRETCKECGHHRHGLHIPRASQQQQSQPLQQYQPQQYHQAQQLQAQQPQHQRAQQHQQHQHEQQQGRSYGDILAGAFANHASVYPLNPLIASANFSMGSTEVRPGDWTCGDCRFSNFAYRYTCKNCSCPKPEEAPAKNRITLPHVTHPGTGVSQLRKAGDWICHACHFSNFAYRWACKNCAASRNEKCTIEVTTKSEVAFERPGDWSCAACNYSNFAYRDVCNNCSHVRSDQSGGILQQPKKTEHEEDQTSPELLLSTLNLLDEDEASASIKLTPQWHCRQCVINNEDSPQCRGCGNRRSLLETKSEYIRNTLQNPSRRSSSSPLESLVMEGRAPRHSMPSLITSQSRINSIIEPSSTNPRNSVISANNGSSSYASKPWVCQTCEAENSAMKIRCRECGEVNLGGAKRPESAAVTFDRVFYSV